MGKEVYYKKPCIIKFKEQVTGTFSYTENNTRKDKLVNFNKGDELRGVTAVSQYTVRSVSFFFEDGNPAPDVVNLFDQKNFDFFTTIGAVETEKTDPDRVFIDPPVATVPVEITQP